MDSTISKDSGEVQPRDNLQNSQRDCFIMAMASGHLPFPSLANRTSGMGEYPKTPERPKAITHRYELYCASKAAKTTQCTVHCDLSVQDCEGWNRSRQEEGRWDDEVLAALAMRCNVISE